MVARVIWADMLSIAVTYFITLCLFPGLESEIRHCVLGEWLPILIMAVFNLSDFVGKVGCPPGTGPEHVTDGGSRPPGPPGMPWRCPWGCVMLLGAEGGAQLCARPGHSIEGSPGGPQASPGVTCVPEASAGSRPPG